MRYFLNIAMNTKKKTVKILILIQFFSFFIRNRVIDRFRGFIQNRGSNMADENAKSYLIGIKFGTWEF